MDSPIANHAVTLFQSGQRTQPHPDANLAYPTIERIIALVRNYQPIKDNTDRLRQLLDADPAEYKARKSESFSIIASGKWPNRSRDNPLWSESSNLVFAEADKLDSESLDDLRRRVNDLPWVVASYVSNSGTGLHIYVALDQPHIDHAGYTRSWAYVNELLATSLDVPPQTFDPQVHNAERLAFLAHDPEAYYNANATALTVPDDYQPPTPTYASGLNNPYAETATDFYAIIRDLGIEFRFNELARCLEVRVPNQCDWNVGASGPALSHKWERFDDSAAAVIRNTITERATKVNAKGEAMPYKITGDDFATYLIALERLVPVNPFRDYLDDLPEWDSNKRIDGLLKVLFQIDDDLHSDDYLALAARCLILPMVARTYKPGFPSPTITNLVGRQGIGKSLLPSRLLPDKAYFLERLSLAADDKEMVAQTQGKVLAEYSELAGAGRKDNESRKAMLSATNDTVRLPYRRNASDYPRRWSAYGTSNDDRPLPKDDENRRYLNVRVGGTSLDNKVEAALAYLDENRVQIWSEAVALWRSAGVDLDDDANDAAFLDLWLPERSAVAEEALRLQKEATYQDEAILDAATTAILNIGPGRHTIYELLLASPLLRQALTGLRKPGQGAIDENDTRDDYEVCEVFDTESVARLTNATAKSDGRVIRTNFTATLKFLGVERQQKSARRNGKGGNYYIVETDTYASLLAATYPDADVAAPEYADDGIAPSEIWTRNPDRFTLGSFNDDSEVETLSNEALHALLHGARV